MVLDFYMGFCVLKLYFGEFATPILARVRLIFLTPGGSIKNASVCRNRLFFLT